MSLPALDVETMPERATEHLAPAQRRPRAENLDAALLLQRHEIRAALAQQVAVSIREGAPDMERDVLQRVARSGDGQDVAAAAFLRAGVADGQAVEAIAVARRYDEAANVTLSRQFCVQRQCQSRIVARRAGRNDCCLPRSTIIGTGGPRLFAIYPIADFNQNFFRKIIRQAIHPRKHSHRLVAARGYFRELRQIRNRDQPGPNLGNQIKKSQKQQYGKFHKMRLEDCQITVQSRIPETPAQPNAPGAQSLGRIATPQQRPSPEISRAAEWA
jgi:hypothetical protein